MCIWLSYATVHTDAHVHSFQGARMVHLPHWWAAAHGGTAVLSTHAQPRPSLRIRMRGPTSPRGSPTRLKHNVVGNKGALPDLGCRWGLGGRKSKGAYARRAEVARPEGTLRRPRRKAQKAHPEERGGTARRDAQKTEVARPEGKLRRREGRRAT